MDGLVLDISQRPFGALPGSGPYPSDTGAGFADMWMDILDGRSGPRRGDRLRSPKTTYWVISSRRVKRRDPSACPRYDLRVVKADEIEPYLRDMLLRSALRRGASTLFKFTWYPRKCKARSFEDLMRGA